MLYSPIQRTWLAHMLLRGGSLNANVKVSCSPYSAADECGKGPLREALAVKVGGIKINKPVSLPNWDYNWDYVSYERPPARQVEKGLDS